MAEEMAPLTATDLSWELLVQSCRDHVPNEMKVSIIPICNILETAIKSNEELPAEWIENTLLRLEACLDRTWEVLNSGHWKNVSIQYRYCYTICSVLKSIVLEMKLKNGNTNQETDAIKKIIEQVDKGLLLGAPLDTMPDILSTIATKLNEKHPSNTKLDSTPDFYHSTDIPNELLPGFKWTRRFHSPPMETFYCEIFVKKIPAVLEGCIDHWKALTLWKDPNYLIKIAGNRTVPIEIGSKYTEEDWSQCLIKFSDFIKSHLVGGSQKIGYLAQHQLFHQIPELKKDFSIPDYCTFTDDVEDSYPDINAWFGPKGTLSPLHHDPKNNLLCQVFGSKQIILYPPEDSNHLYPYETRLLNNTAQVDPLKPDYVKFPNFSQAKGVMCYLKEGEMLFIPPGWWHHVVSLTPSFSISFWW